MVSVSVIGGPALYLNRQKTTPVSPAEPMAKAAPSRTMEDTQSVKAVAMQQTQPQVSTTAADSSQTPLVSYPADEALLVNDDSPQQEFAAR